MNIIDRFIGYTKIDTTSQEIEDVCPSNETEFILAKVLVNELSELGLQDIELADNCFVYATLKSNLDHEIETIGLLAHMDTSNATSGKDIKARLIENYDGNDIELSDGIYTKVGDYPELKEMKGKRLIVTDGKTLLGGDDKAGIAIIMDFLQQCHDNPNISHGNIRICFTPDEETGMGIGNIDVNKFVCDYAYTIDGGAVNEITYECFNAAGCIVHFNGNSIHPGSAKGKMINACQLAIDFHNMLPVFDRPEFTEKKEGFNHLLTIKGDCQYAESNYIIRNHDLDLLHKQMKQFELIAGHMNSMYDNEMVRLDMKETYHNMKECFAGKMEIIEQVKQALSSLSYEALETPIRGGTDGSRLSFMGIPTPNLGTGGLNCHGNHELVCVDDMLVMVQLLIKICDIASKRGIK